MALRRYSHSDFPQFASDMWAEMTPEGEPKTANFEGLAIAARKPAFPRDARVQYAERRDALVSGKPEWAKATKSGLDWDLRSAESLAIEFGEVFRLSEGNPSHNPLRPLLLALWDLPPEVRARAEHHGIYPHSASQIEPDASSLKRRRYPSAAHALDTQMHLFDAGSERCLTKQTPRQQLVMPGFQSSLLRGPIAPPNWPALATNSGGGRGRSAAPIPYRLIIRSLADVPMQNRAPDSPVIISYTWREIRAKLFTNLKGESRGHTTRSLYEKILNAGLVIDSVDARLPWFDEESGVGGLRRVVMLLDIPRAPEYLDDLFQIQVTLPPGMTSGAELSPNLFRWGVEDSIAFTGLLNLNIRWSQPGTNWMPSPQGGPGAHRRNDPSAWPNSNDLNEMISIFAPHIAGRKPNKLMPRISKALDKLASRGELSITPDGLILPPG